MISVVIVVVRVMLRFSVCFLVGLICWNWCRLCSVRIVDIVMVSSISSIKID